MEGRGMSDKSSHAVIRIRTDLPPALCAAAGFQLSAVWTILGEREIPQRQRDNGGT
jgi:hypothetical protein